MRKTGLIFILILINTYSLLSQGKDDKKEFKRKFIDAEYFFLLEEFEESAFLYAELLNEDPTNANLKFMVGASYLSIPGKKTLAIPYLEEAVQSISPSYREGSYKERNAPKECLYALARAYHINNQVDLAEMYYKRYKDVMQLRDVAEIEFINKQVKSIELAKTMILDTLEIDMSYVIDNHDTTEVSRYNAVYCEQESFLVYMSDMPFYSAIMMAYNRDGKWTEPEIINGQIELDGQINLCSVSFDGEELYLTKKEDYNTDIYVSRFKKGKWTKAEPLAENINTIFNETHAAVNKEKTILYFTSDRPDGNGAMDIYLSNRNENGEWGEPVNLGKPVNSIYSEETPFITEDGKTLYFSSMSHATMGGFDLFYSTKLPDGKWSYPANLGFPLSSNDDDLHYQPIMNGLKAIYTGRAVLFPKNDMVVLSTSADDTERQVRLKGKVVLDDDGLLSENTKVNLVDPRSDSVIASTTPDPETGDYSFNIPAGDYKVNVESEGYDTLSQEVNILPQHPVAEVTMENTMTPDDVSTGEYVVAKNVLFGFDSHELTEDAKFELEKLYQVMADNPEMVIELTGHTDSKGSDEYNLRLSNRRTRSVVDYLVSRGIGEDRFISHGAGEAGNIAINENADGTDNPEGRKYNRQVEIKLINVGTKNISMEEYMVPEHLKPAARKKYYVILDDTNGEIRDLIDDTLDQKIKLFETGRKHIYAAGSFSDKRKAIEYLSDMIDSDFPDGRIVNEEEFKYLLKPSVPDLAQVKGPFTIQILALRNPVELDDLEEGHNIRQIRSKDGFYRYISGIYDKYDVAQDSLVTFVVKGYTDAFIIPLSRFDSSLHEDEIRPEDYDYYFTIQFSATRKPAGEEFFRDIENIVSYKGPDGFYRYSTGIYLNRSEAEKTLNEIREKGYQDAFIKKISRE